VLEPERTGETVAEVCERHGISRASFYRYRRRFLEEGAAGLEPRSSPAQIEPALEARIVELRKRHRRWGAASDPRRDTGRYIGDARVFALIVARAFGSQAKVLARGLFEKDAR
jgi:Helix-turn-helix domain